MYNELIDVLSNLIIAARIRTPIQFISISACSENGFRILRIVCHIFIYYSAKNILINRYSAN